MEGGQQCAVRSTAAPAALQACKPCRFVVQGAPAATQAHPLPGSWAWQYPEHCKTTLLASGGRAHFPARAATSPAAWILGITISRNLREDGELGSNSRHLSWVTTAAGGPGSGKRMVG